MRRKNLTLNDIKKLSLPILKRNNVKKASVFGSYAKEKQTKNSDVDFLIEFKGRKSLFDLAGLKIELEEKLEKDVDVLTYRSINHLIREGILKEEIRIL